MHIFKWFFWFFWFRSRQGKLDTSIEKQIANFVLGASKPKKPQKPFKYVHLLISQTKKTPKTI
jgi:hypothetical protein